MQVYASSPPVGISRGGRCRWLRGLTAQGTAPLGAKIWLFRSLDRDWLLLIVHLTEEGVILPLVNEFLLDFLVARDYGDAIEGTACKD